MDTAKLLAHIMMFIENKVMHPFSVEYGCLECKRICRKTVVLPWRQLSASLSREPRTGCPYCDTQERKKTLLPTKLARKEIQRQQEEKNDPAHPRQLANPTRALNSGGISDARLLFRASDDLAVLDILYGGKGGHPVLAKFIPRRGWEKLWRDNEIREALRKLPASVCKRTLELLTWSDRLRAGAPLTPEFFSSHLARTQSVPRGISVADVSTERITHFRTLASTLNILRGEEQRAALLDIANMQRASLAQHDPFSDVLDLDGVAIKMADVERWSGDSGKSVGAWIRFDVLDKILGSESIGFARLDENVFVYYHLDQPSDA